MGTVERVRWQPRRAAQRAYDGLYHDYLALARHFGEGSSDVMKRLRWLVKGSPSGEQN